MTIRCIVEICLVFGSTVFLSGQQLAATPPMGWNSWDAFGTTVRESEVRANADAMAALKQYGWEYVVIDIQWYEPNAQAHGYRAGAKLSMDDHGRLIPAVNRFPSAAEGKGFKPLADYVHSKGLKFGIHILRGVPRQAVEENTVIDGAQVHAADVADRSSICAWNTDMYGVDMSKPGAQSYYDSAVALYASWGVDFIKADDMSRPYHQAEIEGLHKAIVHSGRSMVLSLSPGPAPIDELADLRANAQMWRIEDDLWDDWGSLKNMEGRIEKWYALAQPGGWPDADMLPLGHIGLRAERGNNRLSSLTHDEQRTMMTLWSIARSPLMFGGDLATLDPFTRSLIGNGEVLRVDQYSVENRLAYKANDLRVWTARAGAGAAEKAIYVAIVNLGDQAVTQELKWSTIELHAPDGSVRDLWTGDSYPIGRSLAVKLAPHASTFLKLTGR